jgi:hypothetical protein
MVFPEMRCLTWNDERNSDVPLTFKVLVRPNEKKLTGLVAGGHFAVGGRRSQHTH